MNTLRSENEIDLIDTWEKIKYTAEDLEPNDTQLEKLKYFWKRKK